MATFYVPQQYEGMSLDAIASQRNDPTRTDVIEGLTGVNRNTPLKTGQQLSIKDDPGMGEYQWLQRMFTAQPQYKEKKKQAKEKQLTQQSETGKTEAIGTLEKGRAPLKQRYDEIIASIKGTAAYETGQAEKATAESFGKRGIPLTSGIYQQELQKARLPVETATASSLAGVGLQEEQANQARDFAISNIQSATTREQVQTAMQLYQIAENAKQQGLSLEESARQFNENLAYQKSKVEETDPYARFKTLGEGSTLYDLLTGQNIFTAPKTYKPGGEGDNPAGV